MEGCIAEAVYDFPKEAHSDLALTTGDIVKVTKQINEEWCSGVIGNQTGQFPHSFVKVLLKDAPSRVFVAIADFVGQEEGDMKFKNGEIIGLQEEIDENWIHGISNSSHGLCPKSFLREIEFDSCEHDPVNNYSNDNGKCIEASAYGESIDAFSAQSCDELSFPKGEKIEIVKEIDSFWTEGVFNGKRGKFPSMFVKVVVPLPLDLQFKEGDDDRDKGIKGETVASAKALFLYVGSNADELSFDKGDIITLLERVGNQWYKGQIGKSVGLFPANHVDIIVDLPYEIPEPDKDKEHNHKNAVIKPNSRKEIDSESREENNAKLTVKQKPLLLKPKPSIKPKISQPKPSDSKKGSKTKPILLTSLKQKQNSSTAEGENEANSEENEEKNVTKTNILKPNEAPTITRSKTLKQSKPPVRPPSAKMANGKCASEAEKSKGICSGAKTKPSIAERPKQKTAKPALKVPVLQNDMPLLDTNKKLYKTEQKISSAKPVSANVKLLSQELNSLDLDENSNEKSVSNSVFYMNHNTKKPDEPSSNGVEAKPDPKKVKQEAPKRPNKHPSRSSSSMTTRDPSIVKSSSSSPKLPVRDSPSSSPNVLKEKRRQNGINSSKSKTLPPRLPKPLAPQPPQKPPVSPRFPKTDATEMIQKTNQPSFQAYQGLDGEPLSKANGIFNGKQDSNAKETQSSMFYVDFLALDSVDGQDEKEIETVEKKIVQIKGQIETESNMLSGIETLLEFSEDEANRSELRYRQRSLSSSLMNLSEELDAYQDEKSYLLASFGDSAAIKDRIEDLSKQIESYKENGAKLRRMKDIATIDELAEIKDGIEFCDNMVETLAIELTSLQQKIKEEEQQLEKEDPAEVRKKLLNQREKAITELIKTERDYVRDIDLCATTILPQLARSKAIDCEKLFGNLSEICSVSKTLLESLEKIAQENEKNLGEQLGQCFANVSFDLKQEYSTYCRNYDESQVLLEKLEQDGEVKDEIFNAVTTLREETGLWDLSSYLIKPVQRILKYPLILQEIYKFSPEDDSDRESIQEAMKVLRNVATAINELKRRKDLVQKYQRNERIGNKIQKLNWHSVRKKSLRINQKITQFTGLVAQTVDETFIEEEKRFRSIEKLIKNFIRSLEIYLEYFQESTNLQVVVANGIKELGTGAPIQDEVESFINVVIILKDVICPKFTFVVKTRVFDPLDRLLQLFQSPLKLIEKRQDKCLDYDRMLNRAQKNKDADKIKQVSDELTMAKNNYEALNSQLLEELPRLSNKILNFFHFCLANFVKARLRYFTEVTDGLKLTLQLHLIQRHSNAEIIQKHAESLVFAAEKISQLLFFPEKITSYDGPARPESLTLSRETFSSFYVDMLFEPNENDPTSPMKPSGAKFELNEAIPEKPIPLPRRKSLRRSSSSHSPLKSPGLVPNSNPSPTRIQRIGSLEENALVPCGNELYIAEYSFEREDAAEISVDEGTLCHVIRKHDKECNPEWWLIETSFGRGYVPSAYLRPYKGDSQASNQVLSGDDRNIGLSYGNQNIEEIPNGGADKNNGVERRRVRENSIHEEQQSVERLKEPDNKCDVIEQPSSCHAPTENAASLDRTDGGASVMARKDLGKAIYRAMYDFEATEIEEMSIVEGDMLDVLKIGDDNGNDEWCYVACKGNYGYVPFNYLEPLDSSQGQ